MITPSPRFDFPITVWPQMHEEELQAREYFVNIYSVTLNHTTSVLFVPAFTHTDDWIAKVPTQDIDNVVSAEQARIISAAFAAYTITPDAAQAGLEDTFTLTGDREVEALQGTLLFVTPEQFDTFLPELAEVAADMRGPFDSRLLSTLKNYEFVSFLLTHLVEAKRLEPVELRMLAR